MSEPDSPRTDSLSAAGRLVVVSGPSGAGKSTVLTRLLQTCPLPLVMSVSATTRPPRAGEVDGTHYHFLSGEEFERRRQAGKFLECEEVFESGCWYGTLREEVTTGLAGGKWVILEIDVDGAQKVLKAYPETLSIFIRPESLRELERRLRDRGTETKESIARRLQVARREWTFIDRYRHEVINNTIAQATHDICELLREHNQRTSHAR